MKWVELSLDVDIEAVEPISELLSRYVYGGVAIERNAVSDDSDGNEAPWLSEMVQVRGYLRAQRGWEDKLRHVEVAASLLGQLRRVGPVHYRLLAEEDWSTSWKQHYHPLVIGKRVVVKPSWEDCQLEPGQVVVELDPGMAFGTGLHPTTQLCLRQLEQYVKPGASVLDVGTGSGILAIAACRLGASTVLAVDTDPVAVEAATNNVAHNGLQSCIVVKQGSVPLSTESEEPVTVRDQQDVSPNAPARFDLVVANIVATVICELADDLVHCLRPSGVLIVSGIIADKADMVAATLRNVGVGSQSREQMGDWITIVGTR